jgi:capsular polysaccharide export protein
VSDASRAAVERLPQDAPLAATSAGLLEIPHLAAFLGGRAILPYGRRAGAAGYVGWGLKRSGLNAQRLALADHRPVAILEDGFIRSVGLGKSGAPPVSLVLDDTGIYYDARHPSRLERLLSDVDTWLTQALRFAAANGLARWQAERLSKYNLGVDQAAQDGHGRRIILVDQVAGDASIAGALATRATFSGMLAAALAHYPTHRLAVRVHPDVAAGKARGHLVGLAQAAGITILADNVTPHAVLDAAEAIWTVSSGLGFEAILRGVPVVTFGVPFYAGYGLSDDSHADTAARVPLQRRGQSRSREEVFAAAFLAYARYADPVTHLPLTFDGACDRLVDWRRRAGELAVGKTYAYGFSRWKQVRAGGFLGAPAAPVVFAGRPSLSRLRRARDADRIAVWGITDPAGFEFAVRASSRAFLRVEDGFIRSVGLGSDIRPAGSLVLDDVGIYYDATRPSRLEQLIADGPFDAALLARAAAVRTRLAAQSLTKYNLHASKPEPLPDAQGRQRVLVVEQVPGDAALRLGTGRIATNSALLAAVRAAHPGAFVIYKEHPDLVAGNRAGRLPLAHIRKLADHVISQGDMAQLYSTVDEIHVMSSLAGFEALCRGVRVVVWGRPFYGGWGLTDDREIFSRRPRVATLDELVAATLILYPRYSDPVSGVPCSVEAFIGAIERLRAEGRMSPLPGGLLRQLLHQFGRLKRTLQAPR